MEYKRFGDTVALRLDKGDEITEQILTVAKKEQIRLASVTGIGASEDLTVGVFDAEKREYETFSFTGICEITSLTGSVNTMHGAPYSHLHITCAGRDGTLAGGHLLRCVVGLTAEIFRRIVDGAVDRKRNETLGINTWSFDCE